MKKIYNEIRTRKGKLDDIAIGKMHFERMTSNIWWLGYYKGDERVCFWIKSKSRIDVALIEDFLDCVMVEQET